MAENKSSGRFGGLFGIEAGFKFLSRNRVEEKELQKDEYIELDGNDGTEILDSMYITQTRDSLEGSFRTQAELVNEYRAMSQHSEVESAIDDVINAIVTTDDLDDPIELDLANVELPDATKKTIIEEFDYILGLLNFDSECYERVKQWYVDGRIATHVVIDSENPKEGIQDLVILDPRSIRKVKEIRRESTPGSKVQKILGVDEYYIYNSQYSFDNTSLIGGVDAQQNKKNQYVPTNAVGQELRMSVDSIVQTHSGIISSDNNMIMSHLEFARRPLNQLRMMEDAMVIFRAVRAPERRVFYIDTGTLPAKAADSFMKKVIEKYRTKITYNPNTGTVASKGFALAMTEDYFIPRREGSTAAQIDTLSGSDASNILDEVNFLKGNLLKALKVPTARMNGDNNILLGSNDGEISRDEHKFNKFILRLRKRFTIFFKELLKRQLILKGITTEEDWDDVIAPYMKVQYTADDYQAKQREIDQFTSRVQALSVIQESGIIGTTFSMETIMKTLFDWTEDRENEEQDMIKREIADGKYDDPKLIEKQNRDLEVANALPDNKPLPDSFK